MADEFEEVYPGVTKRVDSKAMEVRINFDSVVSIARYHADKDVHAWTVKSGHWKDCSGDWLPWSHEKCQEVSLTGLTDQVPRIQAAIGQVKQFRHEGVGPVWDMSGCQVDVPAYLTGEPECMVDWQMIDTYQPIYKIGVNAYVSGSVTSEAMNQRARWVAALAYALEDAGVRVQLDVVCPWRLVGGTYDGWKHCSTVEVHKAGEIFSVAHAAYWLGHSGAWRGLFYSGLSHICGKADNGSWDDSQQDKIRKEYEKFGAFFPGMLGRGGEHEWWQDEAKAAKWVHEEVERVTTLLASGTMEG